MVNSESPAVQQGKDQMEPPKKEVVTPSAPASLVQESGVLYGLHEDMKQTAHRLLIDWPKQNSYSHQPVEESTVHTGQEEQENPRLTQEPSPCDPSPLKDTGPEEEAIQEEAILAERKSTIQRLDSPEPQQSVLERPNNRRPSPLMAPTEERPVFAATGNISSTGGQKGQLSIPQRRKYQMLLTQHQRQILPAIESTPGVKVKPNLLPKEVWYHKR